MKRLFFAILFSFFVLNLYAAEEILNYQSDITIGRDNTLFIIESIKVRAEGNKIKRGIYREFPTDYVDTMGRKIKVRFEVVSVERNGEKINYWVERRSNGYRVYMGSKNRYIKPGIYTYRLTYRTDRQIGFFKDHDELYWNVTGQGWDFPILSAEAYVSLPEGFGPENFLKWTAYTGVRGSRERAFKAYIDEMGRLVFETTRRLNKREGFTIVVGFKKGIVHEPTESEKFALYVKDNPSYFIGLAGLIIIFLYYIAMWLKVGKDPERGAIVPLFEPPENLSPAQIAYIIKMGYTDRCLVSAIVNMAIKGVIKIYEKSKIYSLQRLTKDTSSLADEEKVLYKEWLAIGGYFKIKQANYQEIRNGIKKFKKALKKFAENKYFYSNTKFFIPGVIMSLIVFVLIVLNTKIPPFSAFVLLWLSFWTVGVVALWSQFLTRWKAFTGGGEGLLNTITMFFVAVLFTLGEFAGMFLFVQSASVPDLIIVVFILGLNAVFYYLLKAPTPYGRRVMDKIEGFKLYLSMAESDYIKYGIEFKKDVNTFKWFLPYAIALGVENKWSEKFENAIDEAALKENFEGDSFYRHGFAPTTFSTAMVSSMSSTISSSSVAPGSSSGFSGGGGAGGGGGGGGGGGF